MNHCLCQKKTELYMHIIIFIWFLSVIILNFNNLFFLSPTVTIFQFFINMHFLSSEYYCSSLSRAAFTEKKLKFSSGTWKTLLRYFRTHSFPLKARMSISDPITWIYFPSPILIFFTVSNFLYDESTRDDLICVQSYPNPCATGCF